jgi:hypothetical protein
MIGEWQSHYRSLAFACHPCLRFATVHSKSYARATLDLFNKHLERYHLQDSHFMNVCYELRATEKIVHCTSSLANATPPAVGELWQRSLWIETDV